MRGQIGVLLYQFQMFINIHFEFSPIFLTTSTSKS
jgi:hypothetical protein